jgi:hypothetical protein
VKEYLAKIPSVDDQKQAIKILIVPLKNVLKDYNKFKTILTNSGMFKALVQKGDSLKTFI